MFKSILIANRGEIACRIIKTCRQMGLRTIAVYSDADKDALHVRQADEAVHIGGSQPSESYLVADKIIEAAQRTNADAVHPGYGFLSENASFADALAKAGIAFIGPDAACIASMGDKIESKRLAEAAGVPGVPGYSGDDQSDPVLIAAAENIGFPVMVKASAGGGGKGMRRVFERSELEEAIDLARKEAKASFGDDRLLVEKLITRPRHLEVQIAGDKHGSVIHLLERDCSVQRNNQKVLEEAPAPNLSDAVREKLFSRAVQLAEAINYNSLGTVEFIMDADDDEPAFLEMNTRLQVEHPVTELVTGLDLVALQIRIAAGEPLPLAQSDVTATGHAIEARITAEKPGQNFLPDIGTLHHITWPQEARIDTGVESGSDISPFYDSMVAKLITHGVCREEACDRMIGALQATAIMGVETNVSFLRDCVRAAPFYAGEATTSFLGEVFPQGWQADEQGQDEARAIAAAIWQALRAEEAPYAGMRLLARGGHAARSFLTLLQDGAEAPVALVLSSHGEETHVQSARGEEGEGGTHIISVLALSAHSALIARDGHRARIAFAATPEAFYLAREGHVSKFRIMPMAEFAASDAAAGGAGGDIVSDMPGAVADVLVKAGDPVAEGDPIIVVESMKLLITLKAKQAGTVSVLNVAAGDLIKAGDLLVSIEADA